MKKLYFITFLALSAVQYFPVVAMESKPLPSTEELSALKGKKLRIRNMSMGDKKAGTKGWKLLLMVVKRAPDGSKIMFQKTLEPTFKDSDFWGIDNFEDDRSDILAVGVMRYGQYTGALAKMKFIPQEMLLMYPNQDLTIDIDYSITQQALRKAAQFLYLPTALTPEGGFAITPKLGIDPIQFPEFSRWFGFLTSRIENIYDYFPGARRFRSEQNWLDWKAVPAHLILGVPKQPSVNDINAAFIALMKKWNPLNFRDANQQRFAYRISSAIEQAYRALGGTLTFELEKPASIKKEDEIKYDFSAVPASEQTAPVASQEDINELNKGADLLAEIFAGVRTGPTPEELKAEEEQQKLREAATQAAKKVGEVLSSSSSSELSDDEEEE